MAALAESFPDRGPSPAQTAGAHIFSAPDNHPPKQQEGVFYPDYELPDYTSVAIDPTVTYGEPRPQESRRTGRLYGHTSLDRWVMNDEQGTEYVALRCEAADPISDVWVVKDTAWSTQPSGLNLDVARKLMKIGFNVLIKGPEINSSIPLSQSAFNTHVMLDEYEQRGHMNAAKIAIEGYSRGAMIAFGTIGYAEEFGRDPLYSNLTDACVGRPIKLNPIDIETAKKASTLWLDVLMLGIAVGKGLADPVRGKHIAKTVDISVDGAKQFWRTGKPLMTGEAGMMAARTPKDAKATLAFFRRCNVNDFGLYRDIFEDHPKVRLVRPEGWHGGGIDSGIIGNAAVRFSRLGEQLQEHRRPDEIDYSYILHGSQAA